MLVLYGARFSAAKIPIVIQAIPTVIPNSGDVSLGINGVKPGSLKHGGIGSIFHHPIGKDYKWYISGIFPANWGIIYHRSHLLKGTRNSYWGDHLHESTRSVWLNPRDWEGHPGLRKGHFIPYLEYQLEVGIFSTMQTSANQQLIEIICQT